MNYHNITKCDMLNGEGLRVVLWLSHCTHACPSCQNPQTHDADSGIVFDQAAKEEIYRELKKDYVSGITLTGGDPLSMLNREPVLALMKELKADFPNKSIWVYTGYLWEKVEHLEHIDAVDVLVDGLFIVSKKSNTLPYVGSSNQRIVDVRKSLQYKQYVAYELNMI